MKEDREGVLRDTTASISKNKQLMAKANLLIKAE